MNAASVKGGPELRARLQSLGSSQMRLDITRTWQGNASINIKTRAPHRTGKGMASIRPGFLSDMKAFVLGAFWLIFIDRGTKAHDIKVQSLSGSGRQWGTSAQPEGPERGYGGPKALAFKMGGQTVFAKKVHKRRQGRRPFITEGAQKALSGLPDVIVTTWNRKRAGRYTRMP
jgi:hypothetical protein